MSSAQWRKFNAAVPFMLIVIGFGAIYARLLASTSRGIESVARNRVNNCILSKNANTRTQSDIESCYKVVERDLGVHLKRYDKE